MDLVLANWPPIKVAISSDSFAKLRTEEAKRLERMRMVEYCQRCSTRKATVYHPTTDPAHEPETSIRGYVAAIRQAEGEPVRFHADSFSFRWP